MAGIRAGEGGPSGPFSVYNLGSEDAITVRALADAICEELGLDGVEYTWTGGAGGGRGGARGGRTMQLAGRRLGGEGGGPGENDEPAGGAAPREAWNSNPENAG